ncbi:hypothetical protein E2C01_100504 [Portunus trituberculatus]|uniref:Uncharacterized protein n=1 Tax=Portunus trituberculatus TaxID=210409 RepID=A0A5B7KD85_PORTR|nr:hypothetical protein [Portunus trituberculatus]
MDMLGWRSVKYSRRMQETTPA